MTTTLPAHGTEARYKGRQNLPGCRCTKCRRAIGKAIEIRRLDRLQGNPRNIPAGPVVAHLEALRAAGMSWSQIGQAAGTAASTPREIYVERFNTIRRSTAQKLLAVQATHRPATGMVDATGTRRRLQALYALAHGHADLVTRTGFSSSCLEQILSGESATVSVPVEEAVRRVYNDLSMRVGGSVKTRNRARREGWPPPLAWDNIDDPAEQPDRGQTVNRAAAVIEDTAELARLGVIREDIVQRLGITWNAIERAHIRAGVPLPRTEIAA